jgi:hypothetical protein
MDIKFPQQEDPFRKTMGQAIGACLVALVIGLFLGHAIGAFFGMDPSIINTSNYTEYMSAARTIFIDGDQLDSYVETALTLQDMNGLKIYTSLNRDNTLVSYNGQIQTGEEFLDGAILASLNELMHTEDVLYGLETEAGEPIDDLYLRNIAVVDGVVYYYLYYDDAGFVGIAFDSTRCTLENYKNGAIALTQTEATEDSPSVYEWFITYYLED